MTRRPAPILKYEFVSGDVQGLREFSGDGLMACKRRLMADEIRERLEVPQSEEDLRKIVLEIFNQFV